MIGDDGDVDWSQISPLKGNSCVSYMFLNWKCALYKKHAQKSIMAFPKKLCNPFCQNCNDWFEG